MPGRTIVDFPNLLILAAVPKIRDCSLDSSLIKEDQSFFRYVSHVTNNFQAIRKKSRTTKVLGGLFEELILGGIFEELKSIQAKNFPGKY